MQLVYPYIDREPNMGAYRGVEGWKFTHYSRTAADRL